jgi:two-component system, NtrC family, response regulator PilR
MIQTQQPEKKVPSRRSLELFLANPDMVDMVHGLIDEHELPYLVEELEGKLYLRDTLSPGALHLAKFITKDAQTEDMKDKALKASKTPYDVLITGDTGTGKEIIAKSMIADRKGAFKAINCAGIPNQLIESILFGHVKGSFTGAHADRLGFIREATDGVMFLDEIGELPLLVQGTLLRALQEKKVCPVGAYKDEDINCKFVFATNKNLKKMVDDKLFREDLYARISMLELTIKPLIGRMCDAVPICKSLKDSEKFLEQHGESLASGGLDVSLNVRSLQKYVIRYNVWGSIN